jgi:hypothetical protein
VILPAGRDIQPVTQQNQDRLQALLGAVPGYQKSS